MLMDRHRINLPFLHFILLVYPPFKATCFWTVIPCKCVRLLLAFYVRSTKTSENSDISKCFENYVYQALGLLKGFHAAELM